MDQFFDRVEIEDSSDPCWRWTGSLSPQGHGQLRITRKDENVNYKGHRLALQLIGVNVPKGYDAHHVCENRWCVNPDHLQVLGHGEHRRLHFGDTCKNGHAK